MHGTVPVAPFAWKEALCIRFGPAQVWKTLIVSFDIFDVVATHLWTLKFFFITNAIPLVSSNSRSFVI